MAMLLVTCFSSDSTCSDGVKGLPISAWSLGERSSGLFIVKAKIS